MYTRVLWGLDPVRPTVRATASLRPAWFSTRASPFEVVLPWDGSRIVVDAEVSAGLYAAHGADLDPATTIVASRPLRWFAVPERITRDDVAHVARLARLDLSDDELVTYTDQLAGILGHAADVAALSISDVPPTAHPLPLENVLRPDEEQPSVDRDEVLGEAPAVEDHRFRVPPVLGEAP